MLITVLLHTNNIGSLVDCLVDEADSLWWVLSLRHIHVFVVCTGITFYMVRSSTLVYSKRVKLDTDFVNESDPVL